MNEHRASERPGGEHPPAAEPAAAELSGAGAEPAAAEPGHGERAAAEPAEGAPDQPDPGSGPAADGGEAASAGDAAPEAPETELERAQRERDDYLDLAQRTRAEFENFKRRKSDEAATAERRGRATVAGDLIPALDNLERALLAAGVSPEGRVPEDEPASEEVSAQTALAEGVALVYREISAGLQRSGVEAFDPTGDRFDPARQEAISTAPSDEVEAGHVIETLEKGYAIGEQVLRPARVVVSG